MKNIILFLLLSLTGMTLYGQQCIQQSYYWPKIAPNGVVRTSPTQTSEDWFYNIAKIPATHQTRINNANNKLVACGYSMFSDPGITSWADVYELQTCENGSYDGNAEICEFENTNLQHGLALHATLSFVDMNSVTNSNTNTFMYAHGEFYKAMPVEESSGFDGFIACGRFRNMRYLKYSPSNPNTNPQKVPTSLQGTQITYSFGPALTVLMDNPSSCALPTPGFNPFIDKGGIAKIDATGELKWLKYYGIVPFSISNPNTIYYFQARIMDIVRADNGYIFCGFQSLGPSYDNEHSFIGKINENGDLQWIKEIQGLTGERSFARSLDSKIENNLRVYYLCGERGNVNSSGGTSEGYLTKFDENGTFLWSGLLSISDTNAPTSVQFCKSLSVMPNGNIAVSSTSQCTNGLFFNFASGECLNSFVHIVQDNGTNGTIFRTAALGPVRGYDLIRVPAIKATNDNKIIAIGITKPYHITLPNIDVDNDGFADYSFEDCNRSYETYFTDPIVTKINEDGKIEWNTTFDAVTPTPMNQSPLTNTGNPRNINNIIGWLQNSPSYVYDIRREECMYAIATDEDGNILIVGNNSSNLDDSYIAKINNSCTLYLNNHLIQSITKWTNAGGNPNPGSATFVPNYKAQVIETGRENGNINQVAEFIVNNNANVTLKAGQKVKLHPGTKLTRGTKVKISIDPTQPCTSGLIYSND